MGTGGQHQVTIMDPAFGHLALALSRWAGTHRGVSLGSPEMHPSP